MLVSPSSACVNSPLSALFCIFSSIEAASSLVLPLTDVTAQEKAPSLLKSPSATAAQTHYLCLLSFRATMKQHSFLNKTQFYSVDKLLNKYR